VEEKAVTADAQELWRHVLAKIPPTGFLRTLSEAIHPIGIDGRNFLLGHAPEDKSKIEALASANNRRQLQTLLSEASGRDFSVKFVATEEIRSLKASGAVSGDAKATESFKDEPLIREALEMFNARVGEQS